MEFVPSRPLLPPLPTQTLLMHMGVLSVATKNSCVQAFVGTHLLAHNPLKP